MFRSNLMRGVSAGALTIFVVASEAMAQEALPTIDVGAARPATTTAPPATSATQTSAPALDQNSGDRVTGYSVPNATSALKTDTPILQTPVSVQVVTRETMDDQQAISIEDALVNNTSSVYNQQPNNTNFIIRGFQNSGENVYLNGLPIGYTINMDTSNVQSFEVLKGPASVLYGRVEPGGLISVTTKRPLETPYYSFQEQAGSFGETRTSIDATGPLTTDKTWLYRINTAFQRQGSFIDFSTGRNVYFSGVVTYHPSEQLKLNVETSYSNVLQPNSTGVVTLGNKPEGIPISRFLQDPSLASSHPNSQNRGIFSYDWTYNFTKDWSLTQRFTYLDEHDFSGLSNPYSVDPHGNLLVGDSWAASEEYNIMSNLDFKGKFDTGPLSHSTLLGSDFNRSYSPLSPLIFGPFFNLNIYNPVYGLSGFSFLSPNNFGLPIGNKTQWQGVYGQDLISAFDDSVHLLLGGRYDWANTGQCTSGYGVHDQAAANCNGNLDKAFSPRIGLVYQPMPWLSVYGSYTKSFGANNGVNQETRQVLPPQLGTQWEGGVKSEFFDKRLSATFAYFDIVKTNIGYTDPTNPLNTLLIGAAESEGVEAEIKGKINDNWSVIANFSHDYTKVVKANPAPTDYSVEVATELPVIGNHLAATPTNTGNLWAKYDADGDFKGLSVAGGFTIAGSASGDNANSFQLPAYRIFNGMVAYSFPWEGTKVTAQLNVKNLFDTTYFVGAGTRTYILPGAPRTILGSLRVEYGDSPANAKLPGQAGIFDDIVPTRKQLPESGFSWAGLYAGGSAGYSWIESSSVSGFEQATSSGTSVPTGAIWTYSGPTPKGFGGGGQIGANVQFADGIVAGLEADIQTADLKGASNGIGVGAFDVNTGNFYAPASGTNQAIHWYSTLRPRLGYSILPTLLVYGTGGFAIASSASSFSYLDTRGNFAQQSQPTAVYKGWTFGGGIEWAFLPNWSAKFEYQNIDLAFSPGFGLSPAPTLLEAGPAASGASSFSLQHSGVTNRFSTIKIGLNYHFGVFGSSGASVSDYLPVSRVVETRQTASLAGPASPLTANEEVATGSSRSNLQGAPNRNAPGWTALAANTPSGRALPAGVPAPINSASPSTVSLASAKVPLVTFPASRPLWAGLYGGLNLGGAFGGSGAVKTGTADLFDDAAGASSFGVPTFFGAASAASAASKVSINNLGVLGGTQIGYNYQFNTNFVTGLEADIQGGSLSGNASAASVANESVTSVPVTTTSNITKSLDYLGTVRGRLGYLVTPTLLLHATGGLAWGNVKLSNSLSQIPLDPAGIAGASFATVGVSDTRIGWVLGAGIEWMFRPNWSVKAEYLYYDLGSVTGGAALQGSDLMLGVPLYASAMQSSTRFNGQTARFGLNYHFHWGAATPAVLAKY